MSEPEIDRCPDDEPWCADCPLRDAPPRDSITESDLRPLEASAGPRSAPPGTLLIREGTPAGPIFFLTTGRVLRSHLLPNGREVILQQHFPGDVIGYGAALLGMPPNYSATALTPITYDVLDRQRVLQLFTTSPALARKLTLQLARRERIVDYRQLNLGWRTAEEQLAGMLIFTYARLRRLGLLKGNSFNLGLSQQQIANLLGVHAIHVNRMIRRLREAGLATVHKGEVHITDLAGLLRVGCFCGLPCADEKDECS